MVQNLRDPGTPLAGAKEMRKAFGKRATMGDRRPERTSHELTKWFDQQPSLVSAQLLIPSGPTRRGVSA
jgi:hypothetical protein